MLHALVLASMLTLGAVAPPAVPLSIPFDKYVVPENGLEVILAEDHSLPIVAIDIWYHAGPINEPAKRTGFAHLFEHLMFQGSAHVADDQHFELLQARGASFVNGTTGFDRTNYLETLPANELELALWLESDRMGYLAETLSQDKLDNQRQVVMNERRQRYDNRPYGRSDEKLVQTLFAPDHPYYGLVIGSMDDLQAATLEDVRRFYNDFYAPSNATLVIAGDFDPGRAKDLVARYFASLPARQAPKARAIQTEPVTAMRRAVVQERVPLPRLSMAWLSAPAYEPGDAEADILAGVLGMGESSRLYRHLVYDLELAQDVEVAQSSQMLTGIFSITVTARPGVDVARLEREVAAQIALLATDGPTAEELTRVNNQAKTQRVRALQHIGGFGGKADMLNHYNQYVHDPGYLSQDMARYEQITAQSVQALAATLLQPTASVVVVTEPQ
jgi:zinc protease